jgi:hypothetical protein
MTTRFRIGRKHWADVEGQHIQLDSQNEDIALNRFIEQYGFHGQWIRPNYGLRHARVWYRHDFELAVDDFGKTARAIIEVKQTRKDFKIETARRMRTVARHYNSDFIYLYATISDKWYRISTHNKLTVSACQPPVPGTMPIRNLYKPWRYPVWDIHGNRYYQSVSNGFSGALRRSLGFDSHSRRKRKK